MKADGGAYREWASACLQRPGLWFGAYGIWFAILFTLSSLPGTDIKFHPFAGFDKIEHAGYFLVGSVILGLGLAALGDWPRRWWWLPLAAAAVGAFDEWHQQFTPGRSALEFGDWLADLTGGIGGAVAIEFFRRRWAGRRPVCKDSA